LERHGVVRAWSRVLILDIEPAVFDSGGVRAEDANFDTLGLREGAIFTNLGQALANARIVRIVNIDVGARARVRSLHILVAIALFLLAECDLYGFFLEQACFDIITLFLLSHVLAGARILQVSLLREWSV